MADSEVLKQLKDITFKIQTASLKERREVVEEIRKVLSTPGITEPAVRYVCRLLALTLHRYRDSTSQSYVKSLVLYLATNHREWTLKSLLPVLLEISEQLKNTSTSKSNCQSGLYALRWSTVLVEGTLNATEDDGVDYNVLVLAQANLIATVTAYGDQRKNDKAFAMLHSSLSAISKERSAKWMEVLVGTPADAGPHVCVAFSILCRHLKQIGDDASIEQHKTKMLESFSKSIISVKSRPNANYIKGCHELLSQLNAGDVRDALLPALAKAMLRSPETIVQAVGEVFANLNVDLDGLAVDIGKSLIVNLHSKDEWVRVEAGVALQRLAARCSQAAAAKALLSHAFAEYNGASGKLTSSEDKIAVLNGVGTLSSLAVSDAERVSLFEETAAQLARVLDTESHERTLCVALDVLLKWTLRLDTAMPDKILDIFKKNLLGKSTTQAVRTAYVSTVAACVRARGASELQAHALRPALVKAVEKAAQQPLQVLVLQKNLLGKSTTQAVRTAYVSTVAACVRARGASELQAHALRPALVKAVEKAAQQPLQVLVLQMNLLGKSTTQAVRTAYVSTVAACVRARGASELQAHALRPALVKAVEKAAQQPLQVLVLQMNLLGKSTTQAVRTAYVSTVAACVRARGASELQAHALRPALVKAVEKAAQQPLQVLVLQMNLLGKSTTQAVRTAYVSTVAACVRARGASELQAHALRPALVKAVEKAAQQPLQVLVLQMNLLGKSTTQAVRTAYVSTVAACVRARGASELQAHALRPALVKAVEKAAQQPLQVLVLQMNLLGKSTTQAVRTAYVSTVAACVRARGASELQAHALRPALVKAVEKAAQQPLQVLVLQMNLLGKSTTQAVRTAYVSTVAACVRARGASELQAHALRPALVKAVEKAAQQPLQHLVVSEGICAMLGLALLDQERELPARTGVWAALAHADKHVLLHDRVLGAASDDVLIQVVLLCRTVLENYQSVASEQNSPIYRAFVLVLLSPIKAVRSTAIEEVKSLLAKDDRVLLAKNLALKLNEVLEEGKIFNVKEKTPPEEKGGEVTGKMILDCVQALCSFRGYPEKESQELAIDVLPSCHHPLAVSVNKRAWVKLVTYLRHDPNKLVSSHANNLKNKYICDYVPSETLSNVVSTLVATNAEVIAGTAIQTALDTLLDPELLRVSRDEYFTYLTPEGVLYDKSSVPGNEDSKEMNMKRESKAYSYKEQLEELQLRREIEEKKRLEGKVKQVPLSAKQKEAIKAQLAKEDAIRQRLSALARRVRACVELVWAVQRGGGALGRAARRVVPAALGALRSPLAAAPLAAAYVRLRSALLPHHPALADTVARLTIQLHKPQCDLESSWEEDQLEGATRRTINMVHSITSTGKTHDDGEETSHKTNYFTASGFCYVFPLLKLGLSGSAGLSDETMMLNGLSVIAEHAALRVADDMMHPSLFPIDHMFRLLIDLISSTTGRVQAACTVALLETAQCAARAMLSLDDVTCLMDGLQSPLEVVRDAALRALLCVVECLPCLLEDPSYALTLTKRLLVATFDVSEDNRKLAEDLWSKLPLAQQWSREPELVELMLQEVQHPSEPLQRAAASALAYLVEKSTDPAAPEHVLERLQDIYSEKLPMIPARLDQFGHVVEEAVDEWSARRGAGLALVALAPRLPAAAVPPAMTFFVERALADRHDQVRDQMLNAAMAIVDLHGKETLGSQLPVFENFLDKAPKSGGYDAVRQCVVLLVGSLARHLEPKDPRIKPITLRLVAALSTPSQQVQEAVSNCLPHLVSSPALEKEIPTIMNKLMKQLLTAEKYGDRKGAAYGIAGIIKGLGILSLKQLDVMGKLTEAIQEKKNYKYREGALFGFEMLCYKLGRLFEPYIVHVLPHLLLCFGDSSQYVRAAADDTAKLIMSKLSAHGVKLVLPSLLQALQDDNWRTKAGSIELLGAMAYCAPKQLSSCLPSIVPKLIEVLSDSHMRVQEAGAEALKVIGSVIRNPEIQAIVPVLLQALQDPSNKTSACLQTLLDTKFVHFIDAPSLALIMPVVQRAFLDRSTETRKMAAQIIGNMYSLTDQKDLMPYLPNIIPGLKSSLLDPVPEVRSVSARALGAMVKGMGESSFEELLPWLMHTLTSESSSVDRSGAAQGLSEVVAGLGVHKLHKIMPDIIATAERTDIAPHVKDGYIMMFIYMPGAFTDEFTPYIGQIINPILKALADENEYVRETALKAGQRIVNLYAESAITLLLPELEKGLFDDNWRIRYSSVQLLGDLLYRISGVSGKMSTETASEDDNFGTEHSHKAIINALGPERRNRVLAGLYMGRSDVALMVRQAALHVWKVVVTNTPKTLREILPTLFGLLLGCLASTSYDKRQVAARTLGDLVRKLGERVLPEIVPILERGLRSERADQRQGVCIGLGEILASTSRDAVLSFADGLVPTVRTALCDPLPEVRLAAARTFDSLHATIGNKALDDILPQMLEGLNDPDPDIADATLDGLKQIMAIKSRAVLPYLVPVLTGGGAVDTRALSALAAAAGGALARHLPRVLPALLAALVAARATPAEARELDHCRDALLPVLDPPGVRCIIDTLLDTCRAEGERHRAAAALLCAFVSHSRADLAPHVPQLIRGLVLLLADADPDVLLMAWEALQALTKTLDPDRQITHVSDVRQAVRYVAADLKGELLPGFCLPKGIAPILPLFRESILNGLPEDKENAALMLGEVIKLTSAAAIHPSVVHITGPLIRILGDRFNSSVKAAVLETLASLLSKVGTMLKQFLPQLQTTFLKALYDPNRPVRIKAGLALAQLVVIHTRADPLFVEMHNGIKTIEDPAIRETMLQALRNIITAGGEKMSEQLPVLILATLSAPALLGQPDESPRCAVGGCLGALLHCLPASHRDAALAHHLLGAGSNANNDDWTLQHGRSCALFVALKETPKDVYKDQFEEKVEKTLLGYLASDKILIACNGIRGIGYLMRYLLENGRPVPQNILSQFVRSMNHTSNEVKQLMARASTLLGRSGALDVRAPAGADVLRALLPALVNGTKEKNTYVRANAEIALRAVLRLPHDEHFHLQCMALLEEGAREALSDVVARVLRRAHTDGRDEDLDCTLLT